MVNAELGKTWREKNKHQPYSSIVYSPSKPPPLDSQEPSLYLKYIKKIKTEHPGPGFNEPLAKPAPKSKP